MIDPNPPLPNGKIVPWSREEYDADETRERSTNLKAMLDPRGPRSYYLKHVAKTLVRPAKKWDEYQTTVDHFTMGILFHEYALENQINWVACPHSRGTRGWIKAITDETRRGTKRTVISEGQDKELRAWREALMANKVARERLEAGGFREQVITWDENVEYVDQHGSTCEAMIGMKAAIDDIDFNATISCLKTTAATNRDEWERENRKYNYPFSAAFYYRGWRAVPQFHGRSTTFRHIVICKGPNPVCYVFELGEEWLDIGNKQVCDSLKRLAKCRDHQEEIEAEGGDPLDAWQDDVEATQCDPVMPEVWDLNKYELEASQR